MSEYRYYEFVAVDRPLKDREMQTLRRYSSRAAITPTRFFNYYSYGDFKGDPAKWMERYFDAFIYYADYGEHELMLRLPRNAVDLDTVRRYLHSDSAAVKTKGDAIILSFFSDDEEGWTEDDDDKGWMTSIIPLRANLVGGDLRALYLGWLLSAQMGELDGSAPEPPVPAGLDCFDASLEAFADFLRIDKDLLAVAAEKGERIASAAGWRKAASNWVRALPDAEKGELLVQLVTDDKPRALNELRQRFHNSRSKATRPRAASELLNAAGQRAEERHRKEAARRAREQARREREEADARARYLDNLAKREPTVWEQVAVLIATRKPATYDEAVSLLADLKELGARTGRGAEIDRRIQRIRANHASKPSFIRRLEKLNQGSTG